MEFSADKEFYDTYLAAREALIKQGWKQVKTEREDRTVTALFSKNGYGIYLIYGCEEEIKHEIL